MKLSLLLMLSLVFTFELASMHVARPAFAEGVVAPKATKPELSKAGADSAQAGKPHILGVGAEAKIPPAMLIVIEQHVQREAKMLGGSEYAGERYMAMGHLNSCPTGSCCVVLYLLDEVPGRSSTAYIQCLGVFTTMEGMPQLLASCQVGGKGLRYLRIKSVGPEKIICTSEFPTAKDKGDKRSGKADCTFVLASRHLLELPMENIR